MSVAELFGFAAGGESQQLVAETDAEDRLFAEQLFDFRDAVDVLARVARAVREHDAVRVRGEDGLGGSVVGEDRHLAAPAGQLADDVALRAVIEKGDGMLLLALRRNDVGTFRARLGDDAPDLVGSELIWHALGLHWRDLCVHDARLADDLGDLARIDSADTDDALRLEEFVHRLLAAEVRRVVTPVADDDAARVALPALVVVVNDAVVAHFGEGVHDDLARIARVGERFDVTDDAGGEHKLAHRLAGRAEALALKHAAVFQNDVNLTHSPHFSASSLTRTAFCACSRFSASSKISSAWASKTSAVISSPRCAGRQWSTMQSGWATAMSLSLIW